MSKFLSEHGKPLAMLLAVFAAAAVYFAPTPAELTPAAHRLVAVTTLMSVLWLTQAIPIAATSLIPIVAFPIFGIMNAEDVSLAYMNKSILLFLGGFIIALGIEKWGLHHRIALHVMRLTGTGLKRIVLGVMLATGFLSMWISNTASSLLMLPIGLALLKSLDDIFTTSDSQQPDAPNPIRPLGVALMLGICYSANIGGMTTLVGTPTNVQFLQIWSAQFPESPQFSAGGWIVAVFPIGLVLMLAAWLLLTCRLPASQNCLQLDKNYFANQLNRLGPPSRAEKLVLFVFFVTAFLWMFRVPLTFGETKVLPGWNSIAVRWLTSLGVEAEVAGKYIHDSTVAVGMALLMFILPATKDDTGRTEYLMDWETAERLPWGILLLLGGGFAIADGFVNTGLAEWIGTRFAAQVADWPVWLIVLAVCLLLTFLTELTSNVATVSAFLPILAGVAISLKIDPRLLMIPATISASCAFMLPIGTPPNAIVFGSGKLQMGDMVRTGLVLNLIAATATTVLVFLWLSPQLGITTTDFPPWAE